FGTSRWTYNRCLSLFKEGKCKISRKDFRSKVIGSHNHGVLETPMEIRDGAMDDLVKAFESNMAKKKINPDHHFDLSFRSKKD
ncbi:unnamed protein product, partial [Hapterophycus canaliculatus]